MKKIIVFLCVLQLSWCLPSVRAENIETIRKLITEAQDEKSLAQGIESAAELYVKENRFDEYVAFLTSLERNDPMGKSLIAFSIGQTRFLQLKYLEESQQWEQYFNLGTALRKEATENLEASLAGVSPGSPVALYANLLLWQYHKDQQDGSEALRMDALEKAGREYAQASKDPGPLKKAAELLSENGERLKAREFYALYFRAFSSSEMSDEKLFSSASGFLAEGNIDLAESAFDSYVDRINGYTREKAVPALLEIGKAIAYKDNRPNDPAYAEKMFAAAEAAGGKEAFDEDTIYLRAFNLEQGQELTRAGELYGMIAERFPGGKYREACLFKAGIIAAYVNRDIVSAKALFEQLSIREPADANSVAALYQLGLLKQWQQDLPGAKESYSRVIEKAGQSQAETAALAKRRLEEIESAQAIDFPLRVFLDNSLGEEGSQLQMTKAQIRSLASVKTGADVQVDAQASGEPSGCTQVVLSFYWSGDLGTASPGNAEQSFSTKYQEPGIKVLYLLVMSPQGAVDRAIRMLEAG